MENSMEIPQKNLRVGLPYDPSIPLLSVYPKNMNTLIWKDNMHPLLHRSIIYNSQYVEMTEVPTSGWVDKEVYIHSGILLSHEKKNLAICINMDGPKGFIMFSQINQRNPLICEI